MAEYEGVLLDVDGTLVNSNDAHAWAWVDALEDHGFNVAFKEVRALIGMGGDNLLPRLVGIEKDSDIGEAVSKRRSEIFKRRYAPYLLPTRGAAALVDHLTALGYKLAVASSAQRDELELLLHIAGVPELLDAATSSGDVENSKPDPDIVQVGAERLQLPVEKVMFIGDTPYDVTAGRKAGVAVIGLRSGGFRNQLEGAMAIYDDPADLLEHFERSPLSRGDAAPQAYRVPVRKEDEDARRVPRGA